MQPQRARRFHGGTEMLMVLFLESGPRNNRKVGPELANVFDPTRDGFECHWNTADGIVNLRGTVQRHDNLIHKRGDECGSLIEQEAGREERDANAHVPEEFAYRLQFDIEEWLPSCEHYLTDAKVFHRLAMAFQGGCG